MTFQLQLLFFSGALLSFLTNSASLDTLVVDQEIRDNETIVSSNEMYEMGFFSPGNSKYQYVGIWYNKISPQTVVWVANRETPVTSSSSVFSVNSNGTLLILNGNNNSLIWSSNYSLSVSNVNIVAKLLDSGNFVVKDNSDEDFIWQSFDYPGDTFLAGMKVGKDLVTGRYWSVRSWKSLDDPSPGLYEFKIDTNGYPQYYIRRGSVVEIRFGPWNGVRFIGYPSKTNSLYTYEFVFNQEEVYGKYELLNSSFITRLYLSPEGNGMRLNWNPNQGWIPYLGITIDMCTQYGFCGAFGSCNVFNSPACSCMYGFEPRQPDEWKAGNWSGGCQRKEALKCGNEDGFRKLSGVKLPDTQHSWYNVNMSLVECEEQCKKNCSCTAYANLDIRKGGSGCLLWLDDLIDIRENDVNQDLFVRIANSESSVTSKESGFKKKKVFKVVLAPIICMVLVGLALAVYGWKKKRSRTQRQSNLLNSLSEDHPGGVRNKDAELPFFSFSDISKLTNNFSVDNKLGQGGFGPVYKGVMDNGREIAVKRLSDHSAQGLDEFKNEVRCIHKLQHRNLVKILGFCDEKNEVMLIYEYMPNRSLDTIIFDESKSSVLDWSHRLGIVNGIARGLLYLHQDSHLRIIHRDLKAANILLDSDMNPKISDFGLARIFEGCETGANTKNVVGTYFGVLVLEIISGKRNQLIFSQQHTDNLLGHAWRLFKDDKSLQLVAASSCDSCISSEVLRSIHIGLLCVQNHAEDRPTMSSVVLMLGNDGILPQPKPPAFFTEGDLDPCTSSTTTTMSVNDVTMSLTGR
ncbi:G-type lectin S-receptor-like serine/threonine-protein kinase At4g27290 isoform X2 [Rutidosis leptorrhynchoides]|uniref:G-type lectin S-receptor-like serine/threonine-protein kinase At4g27290 isoform X2 n=1 Tax=Rutidosis leptorrhynchoides TaxID=125765 RepID=UPI003A9A2894